MCQAAPAKPVTSPGRLEEAGGWPVAPPALPPPQPHPLGLFSGRPSFYPRLAALQCHRSWVSGQETLAIWELAVRVKKSPAMSTGAGSREEEEAACHH